MRQIALISLVFFTLGCAHNQASKVTSLNSWKAYGSAQNQDEVLKIASADPKVVKKREKATEKVLTLKPRRVRGVNYSNGINKYEAFDIARAKLLDAYFRNYFTSITPKLRNDEYTAKYPDYWFVDFTPKVYMDFSSYLVVIHKDTGEVVHSRDYYWPGRFPEIAWIFN